MNATETPIKLTVKCAWCGRLIKHGQPWPPRSDAVNARSPPAVSHGICRNCFDRERVVIGRIFRPAPLKPPA